ncbi:MAG: hypothetical protein RLO81_11425 [Fulvivirga sp.]|uniref:hypothetical protein n=1 Tax=Fulvivirga sp. TaxID=1931237 RepID=UPI0032EF584C
MIIVKPKIGTLFSLGVFVAVSLSVSGYSVGYVFGAEKPEWYHYALFLIFGPIGIGLLFRMIFKYKVVRFGKGSVIINFPTRFNEKTYDLKEVKMWHETTIKTAGGKYKELEILFEDNKRLNLSMQEHSDYPKVVTYLKKKIAKREKK